LAQRLILLGLLTPLLAAIGVSALLTVHSTNRITA